MPQPRYVMPELLFGPNLTFTKLSKKLQNEVIPPHHHNQPHSSPHGRTTFHLHNSCIQSCRG